MQRRVVSALAISAPSGVGGEGDEDGDQRDGDPAADQEADVELSAEVSITEIGYICGFADTSHFSRRFKQRRAASPSAFRAHAAADARR